ncbi:SDR family oxidoreductase [Jannaschia sp. CCS1]|uniref:SDR family oxidoreductase n=1 Tax=Jannaschia sp. (strain CCS1) TaxID=290400 RepID=UPI00006C003A|nr:SDR family oxidoreductase [Jannaschia sp. CCS1]ABD55194.1 short-chain dehydrogenase/reductase SDR [Jannaschia sp. CCS1]
MDLGIAGRKAIVCGSSRGLGRACAEALLREGAEVVLNGRDAHALDVLSDELSRQTGQKATAVAADLNTEDGRERLLAACPAPDILVNNNGGPPFKDFRDLDRAAMERGVAMNMLTPIELIQRVIDGMAARGFGRIVNITSISVKMPVSGLDLSSGARAGLTAFLAGVARDYANQGVTINQLLPGYFLTERLQEGFNAQASQTGAAPADVAQSWTDQVPAARLGDPFEFGQTCAYLCGTQAGYITGQNILMDGGLYRSAF